MQNVISTLEALLEPTVCANGCQLYDIEYLKEGRDRILRLYIDKEDGIDIEDCERISRAVEVVLDENDPIMGEYRLQVSSPGVERKIKRPEHYTKYIGHKMEVKLFAPVDPITGRKKYTGSLQSFRDGQVTLQVTAQTAGQTGEVQSTITLDLQQISSCRLIVFE